MNSSAPTAGVVRSSVTPCRSAHHRVVMKITGHSDYAAMKPYIAIAEKAKEDAIRMFDEH